MDTAESNFSNTSSTNIKPKARALLPFVIFVLFYAGLSIAAGSFDAVPMAVAFSVAGAAAIAMDRGRPLVRRIESFTHGMGEPNLMLMCLIFVFAGAFATAAKASGAKQQYQQDKSGSCKAPALHSGFLPSAARAPGLQAELLRPLPGFLQPCPVGSPPERLVNYAVYESGQLRLAFPDRDPVSEKLLIRSD